MSGDVLSMTGYGAASLDGDTCIRVETRSVNNRFLKVSLRLPDSLTPLSQEIEALIRGKVTRGTVSCTVNLANNGVEEEYKFNSGVAAAYFREARALAGKLGLEDEVELDDVLGLPGVVTTGETSADDKLKKKVLKLVGKALDGLVKMRAVEGEKTAAIVRERAAEIGKLLVKVEGLVPTMVEKYRDRLLERIRQLLNGTSVEINETDLQREVAMFAEKSDISEEIDRIKSHLSQLEAALDKGGAIGRKLDFLAQELFREANTMASKASSVELGKDILDIKIEVDRIREQVQNVE